MFVPQNKHKGFQEKEQNERKLCILERKVKAEVVKIQGNIPINIWAIFGQSKLVKILNFNLSFLLKRKGKKLDDRK